MGLGAMMTAALLRKLYARNARKEIRRYPMTINVLPIRTARVDFAKEELHFSVLGSASPRKLNPGAIF